MNSFLDKLAESLLSKATDSGDICIVFPSRRAKVHFQDKLQQKIEKQIFVPEILAFEDFTARLSGRVLLDRISLSFELFPFYHDRFPDESFEQYYSWGNRLLSDFDEADRYLVEIKALFGNLYDLREIDVTINSWLKDEKQTQPADSQISEFQQAYLALWEAMGPLYTKLKDKLLEENKAWPGLALRELSEKWEKIAIKTAPTEVLPWREIWFAGFNAFSPAEELFIRSLHNLGIARLFFDMDAWYVNDTRQEAGKNFRELRKKWNQKDWNWVGNHFSETPKSITVTGVPLRVGQAKVAGIKLKELWNQGLQPERIAVVLPDDNLLFPLLHAIPEEYKDINVTMGFPLRNTPAYSLVDSLLQMQESARRFAAQRDGKALYYFREVRTLLQHPYIRAWIGSAAAANVRKINRDNRIYLSPGFFERQVETPQLALLFREWTDTSHILDWFLELWDALMEALSHPTPEITTLENPVLPDASLMADEEGVKILKLELEYLGQFRSLFVKLRDKIGEYGLEPDLKAFRKMLREVVSSARIPFTGEPLKGLQIMGVLETRALDFEHVIFLSMNEGVFPPGKNQNTFIPFSLRKGFQMPVWFDKDAVTAYHFYRLIQRAQTLTLLYNTESDEFGSNEKSRYLAQIQQELVPWLRKNMILEAGGEQGLTYLEETLSFPLHKTSVTPIIVPKTDALLETLTTYATEKGFSPSALITWLICPLKFYFAYVLRIEEREEAEETVEAQTVGNVVHKVLERLYKPFLGKSLTAIDINELYPLIDSYVSGEFSAYTHSENLKYGLNFLKVKAICEMIRKVLKMDQENAPLEIIGLEQKIQTTTNSGEIGGLNTSTQPRLRGIIDRVDRVNGQLRIIDYKTGAVKGVSINDFELLPEKIQDQKEAFQLAAYSWMFFRENDVANLVAGIITTRDQAGGLKQLKLPAHSRSAGIVVPEYLEEFEKLLYKTLRDLFDPNQAIGQTEDTERCRYCNYKTICNRN